MTNEININGLRISADGDSIVIKGTNKRKDEGCDKTIVKDSVIRGDVDGNVIIKGNNITLIVEGDIDGNITGAVSVKCKGDIDGNIINCGDVSKW